MIATTSRATVELQVQDTHFWASLRWSDTYLRPLKMIDCVWSDVIGCFSWYLNTENSQRVPVLIVKTGSKGFHGVFCLVIKYSAMHLPCIAYSARDTDTQKTNIWIGLAAISVCSSLGEIRLYKVSLLSLRYPLYRQLCQYRSWVESGGNEKIINTRASLELWEYFGCFKVYFDYSYPSNTTPFSCLNNKVPIWKK